ncbi:Acetyltransferase (GNAT) family protein [compost metagenome]
MTHTAHRNQGFAKAVIEKALDFSWSSDCYKVMIMSSLSDEAALRLYASAGFESKEMQAFVVRHPNEAAMTS